MSWTSLGLVAGAESAAVAKRVIIAARSFIIDDSFYFNKFVSKIALYSR